MQIDVDSQIPTREFSLLISSNIQLNPILGHRTSIFNSIS